MCVLAYIYLLMLGCPSMVFLICIQFTRLIKYSCFYPNIFLTIGCTYIGSRTPLVVPPHPPPSLPFTSHSFLSPPIPLPFPLLYLPTLPFSSHPFHSPPNPSIHITTLSFTFHSHLPPHLFHSLPNPSIHHPSFSFISRTFHSPPNHSIHLPYHLPPNPSIYLPFPPPIQLPFPYDSLPNSPSSNPPPAGPRPTPTISSSLSPPYFNSFSYFFNFLLLRLPPPISEKQTPLFPRMMSRSRNKKIEN